MNVLWDYFNQIFEESVNAYFLRLVFLIETQFRERPTSSNLLPKKGFDLLYNIIF